jgi:hypothetical protein
VAQSGHMRSRTCVKWRLSAKAATWMHGIQPFVVLLICRTNVGI